MTPVVRPATPTDLRALEGIENAADVLLREALQPAAWTPAPDGAVRTASPGFVLIAAERRDGVAVGFAHVLEVDGQAHLEQLAVLPEHGRRGHGRRLVDAAAAESARRGFARITLRTFADIPWNAPFYATCGFRPGRPDTAFLRGLVQVEADLGLDLLGTRVQMAAPLGAIPGARGVR